MNMINITLNEKGNIDEISALKIILQVLVNSEFHNNFISISNNNINVSITFDPTTNCYAINKLEVIDEKDKISPQYIIRHGDFEFIKIF